MVLDPSAGSRRTLAGVTRHVVLLRGVNIGPRNRVSMPELRALLEAEGFGEVATYLQSGNAVVSADARPDEVASACESAIARGLGLDLRVLVRTRDELAAVVARDPLGEVAAEPKRYQVTFLSAALELDVLARLEAAAAGGERFVAEGRELYAWHPAGVGRSKLAALLAGRGLGVHATARNWTTVTSLLALADEA
jgi:uncharacterized protein (DUF1697 family)